MRQIKKTYKRGILKKLFIKLCRLLGYELINQADMSFVTSTNKENASIIGNKSITLPLGEITIKRKIHSLDIILKTCTSVNLVTQNKKRIKTSGCAMGTIFGEMFEKLVPLSSKKFETFSLSAIRALIKDINQTKSLYLEAGAIHGSVLCDKESILVYMEDVGRHNAVDKVSGFIVMECIDPADKFLYTTGRLTTEMVLKTVSMGIPLLVSRSGFTKSAVELAKKFNLTMIGRFKGNRFMCVNGLERIVLD